MPRNTPCAVTGEGLPLPPIVVPVTLACGSQEIGVGQRQADILAGVVLAVERGQHLGIGLEQRRRLVRAGIGHDDGLAATEGHAGDGGFVGHAARKAQRVGQRGVKGRVRPDPRAAQRGAERRVVDGDDGGQAARRSSRPSQMLLVAVIGVEPRRLAVMSVSSSAGRCAA